VRVSAPPALPPLKASCFRRSEGGSATAAGSTSPPPFSHELLAVSPLLYALIHRSA
jgi:hypothetical protein